MEGLIWIAAAILIVVVVLRFLFKLTGWILKLLILAGVGLLVWWMFSGTM